MPSAKFDSLPHSEAEGYNQRGEGRLCSQGKPAANVWGFKSYEQPMLGGAGDACAGAHRMAGVSDVL